MSEGIERLKAQLELLASKSEQVRYVLNATAQEYLLPDELISDVFSSWEWAKLPANLDLMSKTQIYGIATFLIWLEASTSEALSEVELTRLSEDNFLWAHIRARAAQTLQLF